MTASKAAPATATFRADDGRRLAFDDTRGNGPAVLCLAGLTRNMRDFAHVARHLAPRHRVLRLDSRGRGGSEHADDPVREYDPAVEAGDALALLAHLGIDRTAVIGTSRGGILGMIMAARKPGIVSALVLNDVGAEIEMSGLRRIAATVGMAPGDRDFGSAAARLARENLSQFPGVGEARWLEHARAIYDAADGRPRLSYDPRLGETLTGLDADLPSISLWPIFEHLTEVPVLVLRGRNSDILTGRTVSAMAERHPRLVAVEVGSRGHAPFLDEPEAVAAIDGFLEAHGA